MNVPESGRARVLHVITGLGSGGAEMMLNKVLKSTCETVESGVVCLMKTDVNAARIEALGIPVHCLGMERGRLPGPVVARALLRATAEFRPTVIQGWMYHGNLAASFAASRQKPKPRLIWNIRQTLYGLHLEGRLTRWIIRLGAWLSTRPDTIIYNSRVSAQQHQAMGYAGRRSIVIPNGFDLMAYFPDSAARDAVREEFRLPQDALLIGQVARFHPMKGHALLLRAAQRVVSRYPNARFVLIGSNISRQNPEIAAQLDALNLQDHVVLAGERTDIPRLAAAMDIAVSASGWGEGFSNAVGEAMAAGVPCVVTDVGDSAAVVGETGRVVPPGDAEALAAAICELLALAPEGRQQLGRDARARVREMFSIEHVGGLYLDLYQGQLSV
jgi:glycosyltransferase involved in cell wall biosynthesis